VLACDVVQLYVEPAGTMNDAAGRRPAESALVNATVTPSTWHVSEFTVAVLVSMEIATLIGLPVVFV